MIGSCDCGSSVPVVEIGVAAPAGVTRALDGHPARGVRMTQPGIRWAWRVVEGWIWHEAPATDSSFEAWSQPV
jgi:hypothetical protein